MISKFIVHLLSGGLDSVTMLYDLHSQQDMRLHCLLFDYKQTHVQELVFAKAHCKRLSVPCTQIDLPSLGGLTDESWIVPNRNMILLAIAANHAVKIGADTVTIGCNADDEAAFPDCRNHFIFNVNATLKAASIKVEICAPYLTWSKWKIGGLAREMHIPLNEIWTCYRGGEKPCGKCPACEKLEIALK